MIFTYFHFEIYHTGNKNKINSISRCNISNVVLPKTQKQYFTTQLLHNTARHIIYSVFKGKQQYIFLPPY